MFKKIIYFDNSFFGSLSTFRTFILIDFIGFWWFFWLNIFKLHIEKKIVIFKKERENISKDINNINIFKIQLKILTETEAHIFNDISAFLDKSSNCIFKKYLIFNNNNKIIF